MSNNNASSDRTEPKPQERPIPVNKPNSPINHSENLNNLQTK